MKPLLHLLTHLAPAQHLLILEDFPSYSFPCSPAGLPGQLWLAGTEAAKLLINQRVCVPSFSPLPAQPELQMRRRAGWHRPGSCSAHSERCSQWPKTGEAAAPPPLEDGGGGCGLRSRVAPASCLHGQTPQLAISRTRKGVRDGAVSKEPQRTQPGTLGRSLSCLCPGVFLVNHFCSWNPLQWLLCLPFQLHHTCKPQSCGILQPQASMLLRHRGFPADSLEVPAIG
nr:uncharacterized protein LOC104651077 [Saimiri boliviensis boliviensis]